MARVLHLGHEPSQIPALFGRLQNQLNEAAEKYEFQLNVANGFWSQKGHPFLPAFLKIATERYEANLNQADFLIAAESVRKEINGWVSDETKAKSPTSFPPVSAMA